MWYRCGLAFDLVTYAEVVDAFDAVSEYGVGTGNCTFPMISSPQLRNARLDREVDRIKAELDAHKAASAQYGLSLQTDGKDNVARRHLVNVVTTTPVGTEFREVLDVSGQYKDAEHTAQLIVDAICRLPPADQKGLVTIVTDTPAVNRAAWKLLEAKLPQVECVPCAAHCVNLHFKHVFKGFQEFRDTVEDCKKVVARFSNTDFARHMLRTATPSCTGGRKIELYKPGETRFATNHRMISCVLELKSALRQVTFSADYVSTCKARKSACPVTELVGDTVISVLRQL